MRRVLVFALAGLAAYGAARFLLRAPAAPEGDPRAEPVAEERPVSRDEAPYPDAAPAEEPLVDAPPAGAAPPPGARPLVRTLKVADVPAPGAERTPQEAARAAALDAAARAPAGAPQGSYGAGAVGTFPGAPPAAAPRGGGEEAAPAVGETAAEPRVAAARPAPGKPAKAAAKAPPASEGNAPPPAWNQALVVINEAKGFSPGARDAEMRAAMALSKDPVGQQFLEDQRVGTSVKQALTSLRSQGRATTLEEEKRAVADALAAGGVEPTEEEVNLQLARADAPPTPDISAQEALAILESIRAAPDHLPLTEFPHPPFPEEPDDAAEEEAQEAAEEAQPGEAPRAPAARPRLPPPPGNAQRAYAMTRAALERARQRWGVAPEHPLAIFWQETNFGRFLGGGPVAASLRREVERYRPGTARYRQAVRDQAALVRLQASGELGRYNASNIIGSSPGASFGYTQFRPSSYEAYGRSADGGRRDPFDASDAVYSSANYLQIHGYRRDPARAFWHYNHDPAYVRAVQNKGARIRQHVIDPARR